MKLLHSIMYAALFVAVSGMMIACGSTPGVCYGDYDCTATETCYAGQCVTIKNGPPPTTDGGPPPTACSPATCPDGCCDGNVCRAQSDLTCGKGGVSCADCSATNGQCNAAAGQCGPKTSGCTGPQDCPQGQQCQNGQCVGPPPTGCGPANCPTGCCDASGQCQASPGDTACGTGGGACVNCIASNQICNPNAGVCETQSATCNATNCADGCCDAVTGLCRRDANQRNQFCGLKGATCTDCGAGKQCNAAGTCEATQAKCNAQNCANGCCDANGQCQAATDATCGTGGGACTACTNGNTCQAGLCKPPSPSCNATNCANGCCDANGQCQQYAAQTNASCGNAGAQCSACASNELCSSGSCAPKPPSCSAATCPNGCCDANGQCQVNQASACGTGGGTCNACASGQACTNGQCSQPTGSYPPGPYGSSVGTTIKNLSMTKCGGTPIALQELRNQYKVILLYVTSGSS